MNNLYIIGAGGLGRDVAWLVRRINEKSKKWNILGFLDDNSSIIGKKEDGYFVLDNIDFLNTVKEEVYVVCAVGNARIRKSIVNRIQNKNVKFATLIDPAAIISDLVSIGEGTIICAGSIISVDVNVGKHVLISPDCTIGHDDTIENFVTVYPGVNVSGTVFVGECDELGTGSQIIQGKKIMSNIIVGAGSTVITDLVESGTYVGCPVRKVK